jgi:exodeoxyribonuclease-3
MKLYSWNVNGIRACLKKGFEEFVREYSPDILCVQETKAQEEQVELNLEGYEQYWNSAEKKGYSGVLFLTRKKPLSVMRGIGVERHDGEGRVLTMEFEELFLVGVYTPNSGRGLPRLEYRTDDWDPCFLKYLKGLEKSKPVIFCGDLNVAHREIDIARPKQNERTAGFTIEERQRFDKIIEAGFVDTFREFNKNGGNYTWWSYMGNARAKNIGWRIDYFCISPSLRPRLKEAAIHAEVMGSDHCPISIDFEL